MTHSTSTLDLAAVPASVSNPRHTLMVRITHWITAVCFVALLVSGIEIVISHPRFYWGETGSVLTPSLFDLPIPSSRSAVRTGYGFVLPDQNGWSRYLHFQAAWFAVLTGLWYAIHGLLTGHFQRNLLPTRSHLSWRTLSKAVANHLSFRWRNDADPSSYNVLQRLTYLFVILVLFPLMIWTGLAMSPAIASAFPLAVTAFGGQQSARTLHFLLSLLLILFVVIHIVMVCLAGFRNRMRAMITGHVTAPKEHA